MLYMYLPDQVQCIQCNPFIKADIFEEQISFKMVFVEGLFCTHIFLPDQVQCTKLTIIKDGLC